MAGSSHLGKDALNDAAADVRIGIDVGGTFTDVVYRQPGRRPWMAKVPSTRRDPSAAILAALAQLVRAQGVALEQIAQFAHGTTVATNAVLERKGPKLGLLVTQGFRDILEIGRQGRGSLYQAILSPETPTFLAPRALRKEIAERVTATGDVLLPLDEASVIAAARELANEGVQAIAVAFLFSFLRPGHELRARELIREHHPDIAVSLSSEVDPSFREYERTVVTAFDAYIKPVVDDYLARLERRLAESGVGAPLQVMQSRGGLAAAAVARERPVRLFLSGPAAGVIGGRAVGESCGERDLITVDIGGTSCDIAVVTSGRPVLRAESRIAGYPVRVPMVDVTTLGAGGGSIARIDAAGSLRVGPASAGAEPGPACYARGGECPTVTDASVVLGYIDPQYFSGGALRLAPGLARAAIERAIAAPLGMTAEDAALGIHRVVNAQMAEGIRLASLKQGLDPRRYTLVPLGGAGGIHATALADDLGIVKIVVPRRPGVLAAAGLLGAPIEHEVSMAFPVRVADLDLSTVRRALADLDARCAALMAAEGVLADAPRVSYYADVCYIGQSHHLEVPVETTGGDFAARLHSRFIDRHDRQYGYAVDLPTRVVNLRSVHAVPGMTSIDDDEYVWEARDPCIGKRPILLPGENARVAAGVYVRSAMPPAMKFTGPAIIEQDDTTTLVAVGWSGSVGSNGALVLTR